MVSLEGPRLERTALENRISEKGGQELLSIMSGSGIQGVTERLRHTRARRPRTVARLSRTGPSVPGAGEWRTRCG